MGVTESENHGIRLMLVRAHGCRICVALDAVEGIFDLGPGADPSTLTLPGGARIPVVDFADVTGVGADPAGDEQRHVMVLRSVNGLVGLRVDACLGVRSVSLARTPPMPTRLTDANGSPLCFLLMLDGRPHLMLEPRGLVTRLCRSAPNHGDGAVEAREAAPESAPERAAP